MKKICVSDVTIKSEELKNMQLTFREKLSLCQMLDSIKVDAIELPELSLNKEDEIIYRTIAESVKNAFVKIPVGNSEESFQSAVRCISVADKKCLQVVMPVSTVTMEYFYHLKASAMQERISTLISKAKEVCEKVELVALDAFRADIEYLKELAKMASNLGASVITLSDDNGDALPNDFYRVVSEIKGVSDIKVSVKPSNKLSLAVANAIEAIKAGADGVKTSVCGDNLSVKAFVELIRAKKYDLDVETNVDVTKVKTVSENIKKISTDEVESVKDNAEIKVDASVKEVSNAISKLGYELSDEDVGKVYDEFSKLVAKKGAIDLKELEALVASTAMQVPSTYHLVNYVVNSSNVISSTANITLEKDGEKLTGVSTGDGPIDAAFHAIEQIIGHHYELDDFQVHAVTKGRNAVGSSIIRLRADGKLYPGNGVSTDIIGACIRAYINALNKIVYGEK